MEEYVATASATAPFFSWIDPVLDQSLNRREESHSLPLRKVLLTRQTLDQPLEEPACPAIWLAIASELSGRRANASPCSSRT
jgi:hypothetical protein